MTTPPHGRGPNLRGADMSTTHDTVKFHCTPADKLRWVNSAKVLGIDFAGWAAIALNNAAINTTPAWAEGLSERATIALLSAGCYSRESVAEVVEMGYPFRGLPNAGRKVEQEILDWLDTIAQHCYNMRKHIRG